MEGGREGGGKGGAACGVDGEWILGKEGEGGREGCGRLRSCVLYSLCACQLSFIYPLVSSIYYSCSIVSLFIYSFIHSFIYLFIYSFIYLFMYLFIY